MLKFAVILALAFAANAQVLRLSPLSLGSTSPGAQQIILLSQGGSVPQNSYRSASVVPISVQSAPVTRYIQAQAPVTRYIQAQAPVARLVAAPVAAPAPRYVAAAVRPRDDEQPEPFAFQFESEDEFGTKLSRQENADASGTVTGSYSYTDATGISRTVTYTADDDGFHANVQTNEPGTLTSNPADAQISSSAQ